MKKIETQKILKKTTKTFNKFILFLVYHLYLISFLVFILSLLFSFLILFKCYFVVGNLYQKKISKETGLNKMVYENILKKREEEKKNRDFFDKSKYRDLFYPILPELPEKENDSGH